MGAGAVKAASPITDYTTLNAFGTAAGTVHSFSFDRLTASSVTTYDSITYDRIKFSPGDADTTLEALNGNPTYGSGVTFLDFSVPKDAANGPGKDDQVLVTFAGAGVTAAAFEIGTATADSGDNISVTVDYTKISNSNTGTKNFAPAISSPAAGEYFFGVTAMTGYDITSISINQNGTNKKATAIDFLDVYTTGALPEPSGWALMIVGVGLVGASVRRRPTTAHRA
jgi:hypothetical protein